MTQEDAATKGLLAAEVRKFKANDPMLGVCRPAETDSEALWKTYNDAFFQTLIGSEFTRRLAHVQPVQPLFQTAA